MSGDVSMLNMDTPRGEERQSVIVRQPAESMLERNTPRELLRMPWQIGTPTALRPPPGELSPDEGMEGFIKLTSTGIRDWLEQRKRKLWSECEEMETEIGGASSLGDSSGKDGGAKRKLTLSNTVSQELDLAISEEQAQSEVIFEEVEDIEDLGQSLRGVNGRVERAEKARARKRIRASFVKKN